MPMAWMAIAIAQHRANFDLWHEEGQARSPGGKTGADIAEVPHRQAGNQRRNDLVEKD